MTDTTVTHKLEPRSAADLRPGDRIAAGFLPSGDAATVLFTTPYRLGGRDSWVLVVSRFADGTADADHFLGHALIPLEASADPTGMNFSDLADRLTAEAKPVPADVEGHALRADTDSAQS